MKIKTAKQSDKVYTPDYLAKEIVDHFKPTGKCLEPFRGGGAFWKLLPDADWCEIEEGKDFFEYTDHVDWIITNPPWSMLTCCLDHATDVADDVVFLILAYHIFTNSRIKLLKQKNFGIKEIYFCEADPKDFPKFGWKLAAVHLSKNYTGLTKIKGVGDIYE